MGLSSSTTRMTGHLRLKVQVKERTSLESPQLPSGERRPVILVVEDDSPIRETLEAFLSKEGFTVIAVGTGAAAIAELTTIRPDLVTLDLNLPGVAGAEVLDLIRRTPSLSAVKVVILSANWAIPASIRGLADDVVRKPFGLDELLAIVQRHVRPGPATT